IGSLARRIDDQDVLTGIARNVDGLHRATVGVELLKLFEPTVRIVDRDLVAVLLLDEDEPGMMKNPERVDGSEQGALALDCAEALDQEGGRLRHGRRRTRGSFCVPLPGHVLFDSLRDDLLPATPAPKAGHVGAIARPALSMFVDDIADDRARLRAKAKLLF